MIEGLRPYPAYASTAVPALDHIPDHWALAKLGRIGRIFKGSGGSKEDDSATGVPCVRYGDLYTKYGSAIRSPRGFVSPERASAYTAIQRGDVLFAASGETLDEIGKSAVNLLESPAVCGGDVLIFRPSVPVLPEFLGYALDSPASQFQKSQMGRGFTIVHIYGDELRDLCMAIPSLDEQATIVRFLHYADGRTRRYIAAKQRLIALLEEQQRATTHRALTRGLDPNVHLKPAGVEGLGDVPEHWDVRRLKSLLAAPITDGPHTTPMFLMDGVPFLSVDGIQDGELVFDGCRFVSPEDHATFATKAAPARDHILMGKAASTGKIARVKVDFEFSIWSPLALIRPNAAEVVPEFLEYALKDVSAQGQIERLCTSNTQKNISMDDIPRVIVPVPPIQEQRAISDVIRAGTQAVTRAIAAARSQISAMRECRTRLVADVITGKLDVRRAASQLPTAEDAESIDEVQAVVLGEAAVGEGELVEVEA